ncbi:MAG: Spy/CpxP family protein refolding chaperone [Rhodospirillales bacterium]|nr:Spy/CpxP family protein refolding chaperone [Rhodospirillales bacterium]MBO6785873.1 Spy/CpxP family protein refolding chaperone [Rhodospirillales bacterium]
MKLRHLGLIVSALWLLAATGAAASGPHAHKGQSPYAGMEDRAIKALGSDDMDELMNGKGMGLALPAELNGYPGPAHVLELADRLALNDSQRTKTQALFDEMKAGAIKLGQNVIDAETKLDRMFQHGHADKNTLKERTLAAAEAWGRLRAHHLGYHFEMVKILTPEQRDAYNTARGYK